MVSRAIARYIRISPRKTRKVADLIRGLPAVKADAILDTVSKRPTLYLKRLLKSALDSASKNKKLEPGDLYVSLLKVDGGPMLKRYRAATMGRAGMIKHRTSHITLELKEILRPVKKIEEKDTDTSKKAKETTVNKTKKTVKKKEVSKKK
ncbi:MAG: 50S ribosomal protein L22 [Candidatus Omnitrophota bacterium]